MLLYALIYWIRRPMSGRIEQERQKVCGVLLALLTILCLSAA